jgi:nucleoid-associated protein YgaU
VVDTPAPAATDDGTHRVVPGDNLWTIARDHIADKTGRTKGQISEAEIRTYWLKVIDMNRDSIRSHDPHWIFPGEIIQLPALDGATAGS